MSANRQRRLIDTSPLAGGRAGWGWLASPWLDSGLTHLEFATVLSCTALYCTVLHRTRENPSMIPKAAVQRRWVEAGALLAPPPRPPSLGASRFRQLGATNTFQCRVEATRTPSLANWRATDG